MRIHISALVPSILVILVPLAGTACLSQSHVIPRQDLQALAQVAPQVRGQRVRVIQGFASEDSPPPAPYAQNGGAHVDVGVVVTSPGPRYSTSRATNGGKSAKASKDDAKAWLLVAAVVAVTAAATEGARYDGWVKLHPDHPVHLYGWNGQYRWVPLSQLTPELVAGTRRAIVRPSEGPWHPLGRAPLNRVGWTYSLLMGSSETPMPGEQNLRGFASHIQLGRFVEQDVGVVLDFGLGWREDDVGDTIFDSRSSLEVQFLPVAAGVLHAGLFGQIGMGYRLDDSVAKDDRRGYLMGGGAMAQLELTTRLALTARAAQTMAYGSRTTDVTVGISIY